MNSIELILTDYVQFIEDFRINLLKQTGETFYTVHTKKGRINNSNYLFHGAGCRLEKEKVVCEFDFLPENEYPIKFSVWKFSEFIRTNSQWQHLAMSLSDLDIALKKLVDEKKLHFLKIGGLTFEVFQVEN